MLSHNMLKKNKKAEAALIKAFQSKQKTLTKADIVLQLKALLKEEAIEPWFARPNKMFDGLTPNKLIEMGEIKLIQDMILDMASGSPG